jgi:drug/metabolite transporter (DMT)-like permease
MRFNSRRLSGKSACGGRSHPRQAKETEFGVSGTVLAFVAKRRRVVWPHGRTLALIVAMGALGYFGQSLCYFVALQHAEASLVALLLYLYPAFVTVLAALWLDERLTRIQCAALVLCLAGSALMVGGGHGEPIGILLAIAAAIIYSLYIVIAARVTRGVDRLATTAVVCVAAAGMFGMLSLARAVAGVPPHWPRTPLAWGAVFAIALVSTVMAMLAFFAGLARLGAARTSMLSTLEPVVTVALASLLLDETLDWPQWRVGQRCSAPRFGSCVQDEAVSLEANQ